MAQKLYKNLKKILLVKIIKAYKFVLRRSLADFFYGENYFTLGKELKSKKSNSIKFDFGEDEEITILPPDNLHELPQHLSRRVNTFNLSKPYIYIIKNANLFGSNALGISPENQIIAETTVPLFYERGKGFSARDILISKFNSKYSYCCHELDFVVSLVNPWAHNYFHWIIDGLIRLEGIEYYFQDLSEKVIYLVPKDLSKWQRKSLMLLGIKPEQLVSWSGQATRVNALVAPSFRRNSLFEISRSGCHWLKNKMLNGLSYESTKVSKIPKRIFISRRHAIGRKVLNENEVSDFLASWGFVTLVLESIPFEEQFTIFSQVELIVAPHGAGLTNMIFSNQVKIIELLSKPENYIFLTLAKTLGFSYSCLTCTSVDSGSGGRGANMIVDTKALGNILDFMVNT